MVGVIDGLNMDHLFSMKQAIPTSQSSTATAGTHLATIANTMSTAVTGLTSKAAANHADANRDETIDYKDMPTDVREQYDLKDPINLITMNNMKLYQNDLTKDKYGAIRNGVR